MPRWYRARGLPAGLLHSVTWLRPVHHAGGTKNLAHQVVLARQLNGL